MPIAPNKWVHRQRVRAFDQRDKAKARLVGPRKCRYCASHNCNSDHCHSYQPLNIDWDWGGFQQRVEIFNNFFNNNFTPIGAYFQPPIYSYQPIYTTTGATLPISPYTNQVWNTWTSSNLTFTGTYNPVWEVWSERVELTREQRETQRLANEIYQAEQIVRQAERERLYAVAAAEHSKAAERALATFLEHLSPEQRAEYEAYKHISVLGSRGRHYRIRCGRGQAGNVDWLDEQGKKLASLCCHPSGVPDPDAWMVQKLCLEHDEDHFVRTANYSGAQRPQLVAA